MSLLHDITEAKQTHDEKDFDFQKRRLKELQTANQKRPSPEREAAIAGVKKKIKDLESKLIIDEVVAPKHGLIKELNARGSVQADLKNSDTTDAGSSDVVNKATASDDVAFSLMRNTINASGNVSGSDIANYIERAEELNDEVDTIPFGLETDDGQIVKVYVNAEQADKFEAAMKNMLGLEDDIEEAINRLTTEFDIVDVVWPKGEEGEEADPDANLEIDDTSNLQLDGDPEDDEDFADDNYEVVATTDDEAGEKKAKQDAEEDTDDEIAAAAAGDEDDEDPDKPKKKKKKKAAPAEPVDDEDDAPVKEAKEREVDSPSIAAAIKAMSAKGMHIKAMDEGPDNVVYIEDHEGNEYVMRGDKKLTKEKHGKKLSSYKKHKASIEEQENGMTIGSKFLSRVLQEAPVEDKDGVKDGFNIPLDSQARALVSKMKLPFAKRLIAFHVMAGVPGRYLNTEDIEGSIAAAADMLRRKISVRRAFMTLYEGLAAAKGFAPPKEEGEKFKEGLDLYEMGGAGWYVVDGDGDFVAGPWADKAQAVIKRGEVKGKILYSKKKPPTKKMNEAARQKRGSFIQKLFETVLVELGLPQSLITTGGPAAVGTGLYRTAELIEQDATLERALRLLATRLGVRAADAQKPVQEGRGLNGVMLEAVDVGNDEYAQAVIALTTALGIPDDVLARRRTQIIQAMRAKKTTISNRSQVLTMMGRLMDIIAKNTVEKGGQQAATPTDESLQEAGRPGWWVFWGPYSDGDNERAKSKLDAEKKVANDSDQHGGAKGKISYGNFDNRGNFTRHYPVPEK